MATTDLESAFVPPGETWSRVSPKLSAAYRIEIAVGVVVSLGVLVGLTFIPGYPRWISVVAVVVVLAIAGWLWWLVGRRVRSWGYAERADDLLVTRGIMFRRLVIVPYGRMQLVDLQAGPVHRALGIATVQLHTAAATTDASIPGLTPEVAADLRDRLARRGEQRSAGL